MLRVKPREKLLRYIDTHFDPDDIGGDELHFTCPFCEGGRSRERSFYMNMDKGAGLCHRASCGWRGGAVKFVAETMGIEFDEAAEMLDMGVLINDDTLSESLLLLNRVQLGEEVKPFFSDFEIPFEYEDVLTSLEKDEIYEWIEKREYKPFDFLNRDHRIVVPTSTYYNISDTKKICTIGYVCFMVSTKDQKAYILYDYTGKNKHKTINPPAKVLSRMLYNYNRVEQGRTDTVFIVEGIFDAARLIQRGLDAVAIFGTNISEQQVYLLSRLPQDEICICLDHNTKKKTKAIFDLLKERIVDKDLTYMRIEKEGEDPDSLSEELFWEYFDARRGISQKIDI